MNDVSAVCEVVLPGPEAAARAAAAAPNRKRTEAEAAIADAVSRALHILGSLKQIVPLLAGLHSASMVLYAACMLVFWGSNHVFAPLLHYVCSVFTASDAFVITADPHLCRVQRSPVTSPTWYRSLLLDAFFLDILHPTVDSA